MVEIQVSKGQVLLRKDERSSKIYFVKFGLLRSYSIDDKGKEHIFLFAPEGWIMADGAEIDAASELFIDALENSVLEVVEKSFDHPIDAKSLIRRMNVLQKRIIMLMSASAIERYDHFVETYPDIVQRVPQKMIASYLGITPEALSKAKSDRIRNK